jgi:hypothetical protein
MVAETWWALKNGRQNVAPTQITVAEKLFSLPLSRAAYRERGPGGEVKRANGGVTPPTNYFVKRRFNTPNGGGTQAGNFGVH